MDCTHQRVGWDKSFLQYAQYKDFLVYPIVYHHKGATIANNPLQLGNSNVGVLYQVVAIRTFQTGWLMLKVAIKLSIFHYKNTVWV